MLDVPGKQSVYFDFSKPGWNNPKHKTPINQLHLSLILILTNMDNKSRKKYWATAIGNMIKLVP